MIGAFKKKEKRKFIDLTFSSKLIIMMGQYIIILLLNSKKINNTNKIKKHILNKIQYIQYYYNMDKD